MNTEERASNANGHKLIESVYLAIRLALDDAAFPGREVFVKDSELSSALETLRVARTQLGCHGEYSALEDVPTWRLQSFILFPFYIAILADKLLERKGFGELSERNTYAERRGACAEVRQLYQQYLKLVQGCLWLGPFGLDSPFLESIRNLTSEELGAELPMGVREAKINFTRNLRILCDLVRNFSKRICMKGSMHEKTAFEALPFPLLPTDVHSDTEEEQRNLVLRFIAVAAEWAFIRGYELGREMSALEALASRYEQSVKEVRADEKHACDAETLGRRKPKIVYIDNHCSRTRYFENAHAFRRFLQGRTITSEEPPTKLPFGDCCLAHIHRDEHNSQPEPQKKPLETDLNDTHGARDTQLEDQIVAAKRKWDLFKDDHRRGEGNRYRRG